MADCYDEQWVLGYIEGDLPPDETSRFESMLADDPRLQELVGQLACDRRMLRQWPDEPVPDELMDHVIPHLERGMLLDAPPLHAKHTQAVWGSRIPRLITYGGLAAMVIISTLVVVQTLVHEPLLNPKEYAARRQTDSMAGDRASSLDLAIADPVPARPHAGQLSSVLKEENQKQAPKREMAMASRSGSRVEADAMSTRQKTQHASPSSSEEPTPGESGKKKDSLVNIQQNPVTADRADDRSTALALAEARSSEVFRKRSKDQPMTTPPSLSAPTLTPSETKKTAVSTPSRATQQPAPSFARLVPPADRKDAPDKANDPMTPADQAPSYGILSRSQPMPGQASPTGGGLVGRFGSTKSTQASNRDGLASTTEHVGVDPAESILERIIVIRTPNAPACRRILTAWAINKHTLPDAQSYSNRVIKGGPPAHDRSSKPTSAVVSGSSARQNQPGMGVLIHAVDLPRLINQLREVQEPFAQADTLGTVTEALEGTRTGDETTAESQASVESESTVPSADTDSSQTKGTVSRFTQKKAAASAETLRPSAQTTVHMYTNPFGQDASPTTPWHGILHTQLPLHETAWLGEANKIVRVNAWIVATPESSD